MVEYMEPWENVVMSLKEKLQQHKEDRILRARLQYAEAMVEMGLVDIIRARAAQAAEDGLPPSTVEEFKRVGLISPTLRFHTSVVTVEEAEAFMRRAAAAMVAVEWLGRRLWWVEDEVRSQEE